MNSTPSLDCQNDLSSSITKINKKSKLFVIREAPQTVLVKLFKAWKISHLVFEKDTDAYGKERDEDVIKQAKAAGVEVINKMGRTLYDPDELVKANGGKPTMSITQVERVCHMSTFEHPAKLYIGSEKNRRGRETHTYSQIFARSWRYENQIFCNPAIANPRLQ